MNVMREQIFVTPMLTVPTLLAVMNAHAQWDILEMEKPVVRDENLN